MRFYPWLALGVIASFSGCGGNADGGEQESGGGQAGFGGRSTGGVSAVGGAQAGGAPSTGGISPSGAPGSGGGDCCLAAAQCNDGDEQLAFDQACPTGFECYTNHICCSTVWCAHSQAQCTAVPVCDPGDRQLMGACPPGQGCYSRSACGTTIYCLSPSGSGGAPSTGGAPGSGGFSSTGGTSDGGAAGVAGAAGASCDPANERDRNYVGKSPRECSLGDFICPAYTTYFGNDCGCGCEQDASCPDYVDCMPGPQPTNPLCSNPEAARCPYTLRAL